MEILAQRGARSLTLALRGELDHHAAKEVMARLRQELDAAPPLRLTLDFSGVSFMDSSGIAVALRAQRAMEALGGQAELSRVPRQAGKVFDAAGVARFIPIRQEE